MTTTIGACVDAEQALIDLAAVKFPVKTAYRIAKLLRLVKVEAEHYNELRTALVKELGDEREPTAAELERGMVGPVTQVRPSDWSVFVTREAEIRALPVEIGWSPLTMADLDTMEPIAGSVLFALGPFLVDDPT